METENVKAELAQVDNKPLGICVWSSIPGFEVGQRMAGALAASDIVPAQYQNKIGNCLLALDMSNRMDISPFTVMQNLNVIKGKTSWGAQFLIALINASGLFKTPLRWESSGTPGNDNWAYRSYAIDKYGDKVFGPWVSIAMAKADGWYARNDKWKSMPELMLQYRAAAFFARLNCPELTLGIPTTEEVEDIPIEVVDVPRHEVEEVDIPCAEPIVAEVVEPQAPPQPKDPINLDF